MKKSTLLLSLLITFSAIHAQDCKVYLPHEKGTKLELTSYDKKGNEEGKVLQELTAVEEKDDGTHFTMHQKSIDAKGKLIFETDAKYKCIDNTFYLDMNSFVNKEQMKAYEDMDVKVEMDEIDIPSSYTVGQMLKDGMIKVNISSDSPVNLSFTIELKNRKVEAEEDVTTKAGTFKCVKISQDIVTKSFMSITMQSIEWYADGVGAVKTETYKKGKLLGYTELTAITK